MVRPIAQIVSTECMPEGRSGSVRLAIGAYHARCLAPFVTCEQFWLNSNGSPPHPCRGLQKITLCLKGKMRFEYSPENTIQLGPGDVTSVMVGKGVIRSSTPAIDRGHTSASGIMIGIDIPEPYKREQPSQVLVCGSDMHVCHPAKGATVTVLSGTAFGHTADPQLTVTPSTILLCKLEPHSEIEVPVENPWSAFLYMIEGCADINEVARAQQYDYVEFARSSLEGKSKVKVQAKDPLGPTTFLLCNAQPLNQPIYHQGPFVDVSEMWIQQAFNDYSSRKNGFEREQIWNDHRPWRYPDDVEPSVACEGDPPGAPGKQSP